MRLYQCPLCRKPFKEKLDVRQHLKSHSLPKKEINRFIKYYLIHYIVDDKDFVTLQKEVKK
ncbi:MAG: hypothetical protein DRP02_14540 [Candidatus Gerdarchaeota archaeon]|nr:MAG: hypothetical protein DRP02_14540 [Candidatus Gerdarchaeota archaeon]